MKHLFLSLFCLILLIATAKAQIIEACPNCGDYEYLKVKVTCENASLSDGEGKISLSKGFFVIAKNSTEFFKKFGFYPDIEAQKADRKFMLSNQGETIFLLCGGKVEDKLAYGRDGSELTSYIDRELIYFRKNGSWDFRYLDWTNFSPVQEYVKGRIVIFPNNFKLNAQESLVLASYTLSDSLDLKELAKRGVKIEMYLDSSPVGGIPIEEMELIKELKKFESVKVHFLSSKSYKNFHYKFAVVDGKRVVINTENWKTSNRGYMVEFESEKVAKLLLNLVKHDKAYASSHGRISNLRGFEKSGVPASSAKFEGRIVVFILPDSNPVFDLIASSRKELLIEVPYMDLTWFGTEKLLDLIEEACKNGSKVRILLDSKYSKERNEKVADFLNRLAEEKGYDLEARLITLKGFEALHGKMIYSDGRCMITSANFNEYGFKLNREIGVILESEEACNFLKDQFNEDWKERFELVNLSDLSNFRVSSPFNFLVSLFSISIALIPVYLKRR